MVFNLKFLLFAAILTFSFTSIFSQDLIVTHTNDSINCKITEVKPHCVYTILNINGKDRKKIYYIKDLKTYKSGFYNEAITYTKAKKKQDYSRFRFAINSGFGRRFLNKSDELESGLVINSDIEYFFSPVFGMGIKYAFFRSSKTKEYPVYFYGNGFISEQRIFAKNIVNISNVGPVFCFRSYSDQSKSSFMFCMSPQLIFYSLDVQNSLIDDNISETYGLNLSFRYDYKLTTKIAIGAEVTYLLDKAFESKSTTTVSGASYINRSIIQNEFDGPGRLDISFGVSFML